ncbi:hypothetical protein J2X66_005816 [Pseudomonas sp. 3296]|jgi:hypothetical protein|nr:hypothetical protein [Pseudomonas sp. 3296]
MSPSPEKTQIRVNATLDMINQAADPLRGGFCCGLRHWLH